MKSENFTTSQEQSKIISNVEIQTNQYISASQTLITKVLMMCCKGPAEITAQQKHCHIYISVARYH